MLLAVAAAAFLAKVLRASGAASGVLTATLIAGAVATSALLLLPPARRRWLDPHRLVLVLVALASVAAVYPRLGGDGYQYYILLRSPLLDGDLDFANDFEGFGVDPATTLSGEITSRMPIGTALLWAPTIVLTHVVVGVARWLGVETPADGFSPPYQATAAMTTFAMVVAAVLMLEGVLRRRYGNGIALLAVLGVWLATPLQFYATANPSMSHGPSAFAATLFVLAWLRAREQDTPRAWLLAGIAGGLMTIVRPQDGVLLAMPVLDLAMQGRAGLPKLARLAVGPVVLGFLQLAVWLQMYGWAFAGVISSQSYVGQTEVHVLDLLFSARHGLFVWTPIALVAVLGWIALARREPRLAALFALGFVLTVVINGAMQDWWGSDSFGQRRLLGLTPLFAFGLAGALELVTRRPLVLAVAALCGLILWNDQLSYIYNTQMLAPKTQAISLDRLAGAQVDQLYRKAARWEHRLPRRLWFFLYENLKGVWLDEGPRSLEGILELGGRERDDLAGVLGTGWRPAEEEGETGFRRSRGPVSVMRIPIRTAGSFSGILRARSVLETAVPVTIVLNGRELASVALPTTWSHVDFVAPPEAVRPGFNVLDMRYGAGAGRPGKEDAVAVDWVRLHRREARTGPI